MLEPESVSRTREDVQLGICDRPRQLLGVRHGYEHVAFGVKDQRGHADAVEVARDVVQRGGHLLTGEPPRGRRMSAQQPQSRLGPVRLMGEKVRREDCRGQPQATAP